MEGRNDGKPLYVALDASNIEHQHICLAIAGKDHRRKFRRLLERKLKNRRKTD